MSGADRKAFRAQAKQALVDDPYFVDFTPVSAWSQTLDADACPLFAVATPQEVQKRASQEHSECSLTLIAIIKILGGDAIEDDLDDASDAASEAITGAIEQTHIGCDLVAVSTKIDGSGANRVGTLELSFTVTYWVDDPALF